MLPPFFEQTAGEQIIYLQLNLERRNFPPRYKLFLALASLYHHEYLKQSDGGVCGVEVIESSPGKSPVRKEILFFGLVIPASRLVLCDWDHVPIRISSWYPPVMSRP